MQKPSEELFCDMCAAWRWTELGRGSVSIVHSEHCAQTKAETQLEATQAPTDSNWKRSSLDSQGCFVKDQIQCLPGKQIGSPAEGTSFGKYKERCFSYLYYFV